MSLTLRQRGLNFAPGDEWSYSKSGYVLLTDLVARVSGMSFPDFTRKRLFEPLGMEATLSPVDLRDVIRNRALGYEKGGNGWRVGMYVGSERGGGGGAILSTAADLAVWNDALNSGRLGAFVTEKLQERARLNNGRKLTYARGLMVDSYRDAFQAGRATLRFRRDNAGKVVAFDYGNPLIRGVSFTRLSDLDSRP